MFAYCLNNPVRRKDSTGTEGVCVTNVDDDHNPLNDLGGPAQGGGAGSGGGSANAGGPITTTPPSSSTSGGTGSGGAGGAGSGGVAPVTGGGGAGGTGSGGVAPVTGSGGTGGVTPGTSGTGGTVPGSGGTGGGTSTTAGTAKGWSVGKAINALTKNGKFPSWPTVRYRYWKNEWYYNSSNYSQSDLARLKQGKGPIVEGRAMELHHPNGRSGNNFFNVIPLPHSQHMVAHYG